MSSQGKVVTYWNTQTERIPRQVVLTFWLTVLTIFVCFKMKPYFIENPVVKAFIRAEDHSKTAEAKSKWNLGNLFAGTNEKDAKRESRLTFGNGTARSSVTGAPAPRVLERPLFDGKSVILQVMLLNELDSSSGDTGIEGRITGVLDQDQAGSVDSTAVFNSVIRGTATPNFDTKRYVVQFSEVLTTEGKTLPIAGIAFNPADSSIGIPSEYASGLSSRLLGSALNRVIVAADQVAANRVLDNPSENAVNRELNRVAREGSGEAANGLGDQATKSLRETKSILKVKAGTTFFIKMQAPRQSGRVR